MADKKQDTVYNSRNLSKFFALSSILLLITVIWAVIDDYDRPWKRFSRQNHAIQSAIGEAQLKVAQEKIKKSDQSKRLAELENELIEVKDSLGNGEEYFSNKVDVFEKKVSKTKKELQKIDPEAKNYSNLKNTYERQIEELVESKNNFNLLKSINQKIKSLEDEYYVHNTKFQNLKAANGAMLFSLEKKVEHGENPVELKKQYFADKKTVEGLKVKVDKAESNILQAKNMRSEILLKEKNLLAEKSKILDKINGLKKQIKQNKMSLGALVRNAPLVDFVAPTLKINQIILPHLKDDYFFNKVPRVDRCMTCHATVDQAGFEDYPQPFRTHPKLALMVGADSPHPASKVGCTVCHAGVPQSVDFIKTAHTPQNLAQEEEWKANYNYFRDHHIKTPMIPLPLTEGKCIQCHANNVELEGAETFNAGMRLIERNGCYNCHKFKGHFERLAEEKKSGPSLTKLSAKLDPEWVKKWLWKPKDFRPSTLMPQFWQTHNNSDPKSLERSKVEIESITHYLFEKSKGYEPLKLASQNLELQANATSGKNIFSEVGCLACHASADFPLKNMDSKRDLGWKNDLVPLPGPEMNQMGSKVSAEWLFSWLKNPKHYWEKTSMPSLKLSDQEALDLTAYLLSKKNVAFDQAAFPKVNEEVRNELVRGFLEKKLPPKEAELKLTSMDLNSKKQFLGEKFIGHYACYACHAIDGFEDFPNIGAELTEEGSKDVSKFSFENVHIPHTRVDWIYTKIRTPRIWDVGKVRSFDSKMRMPHFGFNDAQAKAVTAIVIGHEKSNVDKVAMYDGGARAEAVTEGRRVLNKLNCVGCHAVENKAGHLLRKYQDDPSKGPPNLNTQGLKVQSDWLHDYLLNPQEKMRPWLKVRMPQFNLTPETVEILTRYFAAYDRAPYPFEKKSNQPLSAEDMTAAYEVFDKLACLSCHGEEVRFENPEAAAPSFHNVKNRLRPEWVVKWLKDPNSIMPGTRMPQLWPPLDDEDPKSPHISVPGYFGDNADLQIEKVRDYLFQYDSRGDSYSPDFAKKAEMSLDPPVGEENSISNESENSSDETSSEATGIENEDWM